MKVYVMTDLECTAGVVSLPEYCLPGQSNKYGRTEGGKYYEHARELATMEVNAAVEGLLEGGATEILVRDGHGPGGLNVSLLHPEAGMLTGGGLKPLTSWTNPSTPHSCWGSTPKPTPTAGTWRTPAASFGRTGW